MICDICPRNCRAERTENQGNGYCRQGTSPRIARAALHFWEEPCISGIRGSGAIFFSGCSLGCIFCQNRDISWNGYGKVVSVSRLAEVFCELEQQGAQNINLVTASHFVPAIVEALQLYRPSIPIVYNSSGYEKVETLKQLHGFVDIYLPDFKYDSQSMAKKLSNAEDYPEVARAAIREMVRQTGKPVYDSKGNMLKGTLIRHLVLPGMTVDSLHILNWIAEEYPEIPVSVMGQYVPCGEAKTIPGLNRRVSRREYARVVAQMEVLGLEGFIQGLESSDTEFIPAFDGTGV